MTSPTSTRPEALRVVVRFRHAQGDVYLPCSPSSRISEVKQALVAAWPKDGPLAAEAPSSADEIKLIAMGRFVSDRDTLFGEASTSGRATTTTTTKSGSGDGGKIDDAEAAAAAVLAAVRPPRGAALAAPPATRPGDDAKKQHPPTLHVVVRRKKPEEGRGGAGKGGVGKRKGASSGREGDEGEAAAPGSGCCSCAVQ